MNSRLSALVLLVAVIASSPASAQNDWPQWRGPRFNGSSEAAGLPEKLGKENQAWAVQLPGVGSGTPVVFGDRVFVSCVDPKSGHLIGMAVSRVDGHTLWQKEIGVGVTHSDRNDAASPSAVTDGHLVYFMFSTGNLAAFDVDGAAVWERNLQKDYGTFNILWIYSSSPLLYKGKLYVQVIQRNVPSVGISGGDGGVDSYLLALDPQTGKEIFRQTRASDAVGESRESYATPIPFEHDGRSEIILVGGDAVSAHDAATGKELWRAGGWNPQKIAHWRLVTSAATDEKDGLVFACAPKDGPVLAVKDGGSGDVTATHIAWKSKGGREKDLTSDVCVPLFYKGDLYVLDGDRKVLHCVDPKTGEKKWTGQLGGGKSFRASPTAGDGKIYCMNEGGDVWVVAADKFEVISKASMGAAPSRGSIVLTDGMVIVRAGEKLYAFKK
ncbi:MAG: outer rane biosis protein BamB [Phycisphaerales bacterium]|nr:outer rane biosis protein BamB [Phycisphaerales bacterium]